jgi:N-acetylglucosamine-6-phosphate deacetylase
LAPGARADLIHLGDDLNLRGVWLAGARQAA